MSSEIVQLRLQSYQCKTALDELNALKEITQEIALMALSKTDFFKVAEFHGGTALRIIYGLQRFSEDLDFALLSADKEFDINYYLTNMVEEFEAFGYQIDISDRQNEGKAVQPQFLKVDSLGKFLQLQYPFTKHQKKIKIKFEVDVDPPIGATTEIKFVNFPIAFSVLAKDLPSSFSGKLHALLCRPFTKGRDWYDFIWYIANKTSVNYVLLKNALIQLGPWEGQNITVDKNWLVETLVDKIHSINWHETKEDVRPLLKPREYSSLDLWGVDFFLAQTENLKRYL